MADKADRKLRTALAALADALNAIGVPWMCIGGIAVIAQGVRRTTSDIDVAIRAEGIVLERLIRHLARHGIRPRIRNALEFARQSQVLLLHHVATKVELDVSLAWLSFEHEALARAVSVDFGGVEAPTARPEDLVIYKLFAGRPQDLNDAEALLAMHRRKVDLVHVRRVLGQLGEMADAPEVLDRLDAIETSRVKRTAKPVTARRVRQRPG